MPARSRPSARRGARQPDTGRFRIIAGQWRGRRLAFPLLPGLRPTPDRVRETLFNWLTPILPGARCLDLYAGSGALGLEALSREAALAVFVDSDARATRSIEAHLDTLGSSGGRVVQAATEVFIRACREQFDVVFLDPPFDADVLVKHCRQIAVAGLLRPGGYLYLEQPAARAAPALPAGLELVRSKRAGQVGYHLAQLDPAADPTPSE